MENDRELFVWQTVPAKKTVDNSGVCASLKFVVIEALVWEPKNRRVTSPIFCQFDDAVNISPDNQHYRLEDSKWLDSRNTMILAMLVIQIQRHHTIKITPLKSQPTRNSRPNNRPELFRITRENDIRLGPSVDLDRYHDFRLTSLPCLIHKYIVEMAGGDADAVRDCSGDAGSHNDAELGEFNSRGYHKAALRVGFREGY